MPMSQPETSKSYGQILKSTTLVGGSQVASILLGIVRMKVFAVFVGPIGVGLMGVFNSLVQVFSAIAGMGIGSSAVRQVAESAATGDRTRIRRTVAAVRRLTLVFGLCGALLMIVLRTPLSRVSFGTGGYGSGIGFLSAAILFTVLSAGLIAILQGSRRVADIARLTVLGSFFGTLFSIPIVYIWRDAGIVPFLIVVAAANLATSWWFSRKEAGFRSPLSRQDLTKESRGLLTLGLAFMASSAMSSGIPYVIRVILTKRFGLEGVGLYQAAFILSGMYIGIILNAMGMDYYPRLTAVAGDHEACNRLIRQQTEIGLLMAAPAIVATLLFAPLVINLFYSAKFIPAYGILRWQVLGDFLRVVSWPIGYVVLAKGKALVFFLVELATNLTHLGLIAIATRLVGLDGTGIAYFALYVIYAPVIFMIGRRLTGFSGVPTDPAMLGAILSSTGLAFALPALLPRTPSLIAGVILTLATTVFCLKRIDRLAGREWIMAMVHKVLGRGRGGARG
jgi:enterobacterial common antigen flippase